MTLDEIISQVLMQSGFLKKDGYAGSNDPDDLQMVAIANRAAHEIMNYWLWPTLRRTYRITMQATEDPSDPDAEMQTRYLLPEDYQDLVPNSAWEVEGERPVDFPVADNDWFMYKFTSWGDGGTLRVRKYGNEIEIHDPVAGQAFDFEYISKWPIEDEEGQRKEYFTADTDTWVLDDQLLILGLQAHWMQTKLMPQYIEHFGNYQRKMAEAIGRANAGQTIGGCPRPLRRDPYTPLWVNNG